MTSPLESLYTLDKEIATLNKQLREKKMSREATLAGVLSRNLMKEGGYALIMKTSSKRIPDIQKFKELFVGAFDSIIEIKLGKADQILGKDIVTSACEIERVVSYAVLCEVE